MSPTVTTGDFILAGKLKYGARIFTSLKFDRYNAPLIKRIHGLGSVHRGDVMVFNFPYQEYHAAWDTIRMNLSLFLVKRCIGLPGDSLSIVNGFYRITGIADTIGYIPGQQQFAHYSANLDSTRLCTIPFDSAFQWNSVNFGTFYIPATGTTIPLTPENYILYNKQIVYETKSSLIFKDSAVFINDTISLEYTFRRNWYFMAGDNVMNSQDSRYIGLIPEDYIIGQASLILSSKDMYTGKYKWKRFFKKIK